MISDNVAEKLLIHINAPGFQEAIAAYAEEQIDTANTVMQNADSETQWRKAQGAIDELWKLINLPHDVRNVAKLRATQSKQQ